MKNRTLNAVYHDQQLIPGGVPSMLSSQPGKYIVMGKGGRCWDQFDNEYLDFVCGFGSLLLGHCNEKVNRTVVDQLKHGMMFLSHSLLHERLTEKLKSLFPYTDECIFMKTGSEAVSAALRLARAFTGKELIIRCGFHGWHDGIASPHVAWHLYEKDHNPPILVNGIGDKGRDKKVILWDGEHLERLEEICKSSENTIAAFILDPVQLREPLKENLTEIANIVRRYDALLILDEIKTGFRTGISGVQGLYEIEPDLTTLSKGISNGFPLSVVIGRSEIMSLSKQCKLMGTYNGELLSISAALETISILENKDAIPHIWQTGTALIDGINKILDKYGLLDDVQAVPYRWPCMPFIWFRNHTEKLLNLKKALYPKLVKNGLFLLPNHMNFICYSHSDEDVQDALQIISDAIHSFV